MPGYPDNAGIVIIGGGVIGLSVAYHLAKIGADDVILLERHQLTSGTSWHAAGIIGPLRASMNLTKLSVYANELFVAIEHETGQATGYRRTGGLWLAQTKDRMAELSRIATMGEIAGLGAHMIGPAEVADRFPHLETSDLQGALWVDEDGQADPVDVCMAYAKAARMGGVRIFENAPERTVRTVSGAVHAVELETGEAIRCRAAVNCSGAWAAALGRRSGVDVPLQAVERMYVVSEPIEGLPQPCPIVRDLDSRIYIKEDAGKLVLGGFETDAKPFITDASGPDAPYLTLPEDWEQFEPFMVAGLARVPALERLGIQRFMNGPRELHPGYSPAPWARRPTAATISWPPGSIRSASCPPPGRVGSWRNGSWTASRPWTFGMSTSHVSRRTWLRPGSSQPACRKRSPASSKCTGLSNR